MGGHPAAPFIPRVVQKLPIELGGLHGGKQSLDRCGVGQFLHRSFYLVISAYIICKLFATVHSFLQKTDAKKFGEWVCSSCIAMISCTSAHLYYTSANGNMYFPGLCHFVSMCHVQSICCTHHHPNYTTISHID